MRKNLIRLLLISVLTLTVSCSALQPRQPEPIAAETVTIPKSEFEKLKNNVVKLGQDAKYYREKYNDCLNSKDKE